MFSYDQYCPVAHATEILGDRWTLLIVREMLGGASGFNELQRGLPGISRSVLADRMRSLAVMTVLWAAAWLGVMMSGALLEASAAAIAFGLAVMVFAVGECFQGPTQGALVADLAPAHLRGRYMAVSTLSWEARAVRRRRAARRRTAAAHPRARTLRGAPGQGRRA